MSKHNGNGNNAESLNRSGTRIKCTIEITQPDGQTIQVETSSMGIIPELEEIDLTTRKGFMDFISMADKGIVTIRNETAKKALEAYANEVCFVNRFSAKSEEKFRIFGSGIPCFRKKDMETARGAPLSLPTWTGHAWPVGS